ncbi:MAG: hypothetical protein JO211_05490 [Acidobacteriaceae bacterium]|nr:hypothetical protein [Acidobacteriaceae bacterium]
MAIAAWGGLLATAMNLLPAGQLDGGHILYALAGPRVHRFTTRAFALLLVVFGFLYWPWWVGAVVVFLVRRHALIYDQSPLGTRRTTVGIAALLLFFVSIAIVPLEMK